MTPATVTATIGRTDIEAAYEAIRAHVRRTPVISVDPTDLGIAGLNAPLVVKLEQLQRAGSFKVRGAFTNLLTRELPSAGVVAASGGNHGVAVAFAAHERGVPAAVFVPSISNPAKIERIRSLGANLVVVDGEYADALVAADAWQAGSGALSVHAYDQRETVLGQGTVGLELINQATVDTILVPVGGGGLIGGVAAYVAGSVRVIGVEPTGAPTLATALAHGAPVDAPTGSIAADALGAKRVGELMFPIARQHVSAVVLVEDDDIRAAQHALWRAVRVIVEPAAAVGVAALVSGAYRPEAGERVAVILTGANTTPGSLDQPLP
ncbi:MAG: threonine/serine dehydratase [Micromonosporaceae bacterium]